MKKGIFILALGLLSLLTVEEDYAQDALFSQFYNSPVYNNPAFTGVHKGRVRIAANYRDQWSTLTNTTFTTTNVNADLRAKVGRGDFFTYGINLLQDQTGTANMRLHSAGINLGYMKQLGGSRSRKQSQFLTGGFSLNFGQMSVNPNGLWFSNQYDTNTNSVDNSIASNEQIEASSALFPDFSAGILYYVVNGDNSFFVGGAAHHLNRPNISLFTNSDERRLSRYSAQLGGEVAVSNTISLLPGFILNLQGESMQMSTGMNFRYSNRDWREVAIRMGSYVTFANNLESGIYMPMVNTAFILEMETVYFGVSYDISMGQLSVPTDSRGAFELSVGYIKPANLRNKLRCPKL